MPYTAGLLSLTGEGRRSRCSSRPRMTLKRETAIDLLGEPSPPQRTRRSSSRYRRAVSPANPRLGSQFTRTYFKILGGLLTAFISALLASHLLPSLVPNTTLNHFCDILRLDRLARLAGHASWCTTSPSSSQSEKRRVDDWVWVNHKLDFAQ